MSHTIELRKVSKYYAGENTVSMGFARLDLTLDMGEFVVITGESGSGKSTLLNVISGLDSYDEGEMFVCGEDTTAFRTEEYEKYRKTYIGNIFQDFNLVNSYSVYQNIELVMLMCGKKPHECKERINELIELVGLTEYKRTKASKLSGGQKQRVAIARALAKDAPIIVADEPTGNLDSESANVVMETLSKVSKEKLVVIVTHNYDQAEPYATRKLTMHDGRIIEDKMLRQPSQVEAPAEKPLGIVGSAGKRSSDDMRKSNEIKLGVRNTFNLPAKFILLFIVYLFLSTAVLGMYASTKQSLNAQDILGYNEYFKDTSPERIVVTKEDRTPFTDEEIAKIEAMANVEYVVKNDIGIDQGVALDSGDNSIDANVYDASTLKKKQLTYGKLPENDNEVVVYADSNSWSAQYLKEEGEKLIGMKCRIVSEMDYSIKVSPDTVTICGIILDEDSKTMNYTGYAKLYVTEAQGKKIASSQMHFLSKTTLGFGSNTNTNYNCVSMIASSKVPVGKTFISEDTSYNFGTDKAVGKTVNVMVKNSYYTEYAHLKVDKVFTKKNIKSLLGYEKNDYDMYSYYVFVNPADYKKLFDKGYYQVSAYMSDSTAYKTTAKDLEEAGFNYLMLKDSLSDMTGGFQFVLKLLSYASLIIEIVVLFFIAYAVIRLIMRSRNSYYSTLRILGASKKNTDNVLRIELLLMMLIAFAVDMVGVVLLMKGIIVYQPLRSALNFLGSTDYVVLLALLLVMSLLIAKRYSRKIFSKSAMKAYREEV